jgi:hypothetical protein
VRRPTACDPIPTFVPETSDPLDHPLVAGRTTNDPPLSRRECVLALACGFYLFVQIAVPLWQLRAPRPARFGWHMFAGITHPSAFTAVYADGTERQLAVSDYLGEPRLEMDKSQILPPVICERDSGVSFVRYIRPSGTVGTYACPR